MLTDPPAGASKPPSREFMLRVLAVLDKYDQRGDLFWRAVRHVAAIRAKRPGFGGGSGADLDGNGARWFDVAIYPSDVYPCLESRVFARLKAGVACMPFVRLYATVDEADTDAIEALLGDCVG